MTIAVPVNENLDTKGKVLKVFQFLRADTNLGGVMCPTCCRVADDQGKFHRSTDCWALQPAVAGQDFGCTEGFSPELTGHTTQAFGRSWQEFRCKNANEQEAWIELFPPDDYAIPQNPKVVKAITMSFSAFVAVVVPITATDAANGSASGGKESVNTKDESKGLSRHEIVIIAISASVGVIICCVGTFLTWRLYIRWKRMHCQRYDPVIQDNPDPESGESGSVNAGSESVQQDAPETPHTYDFTALVPESGVDSSSNIVTWHATTGAVGKEQDGASGLSRAIHQECDAFAASNPVHQEFGEDSQQSVYKDNSIPVRDLISSYHRSRLLEGKSSVLDGTVGFSEEQASEGANGSKDLQQETIDNPIDGLHHVHSRSTSSVTADLVFPYEQVANRLEPMAVMRGDSEVYGDTGGEIHGGVNAQERHDTGQPASPSSSHATDRGRSLHPSLPVLGTCAQS